MRTFFFINKTLFVQALWERFRDVRCLSCARVQTASSHRPKSSWPYCLIRRGLPCLDPRRRPGRIPWDILWAAAAAASGRDLKMNDDHRRQEGWRNPSPLLPRHLLILKCSLELLKSSNFTAVRCYLWLAITNYRQRFKATKHRIEWQGFTQNLNFFFLLLTREVQTNKPLLCYVNIWI